MHHHSLLLRHRIMDELVCLSEMLCNVLRLLVVDIQFHVVELRVLVLRFTHTQHMFDTDYICIKMYNRACFAC
jgi:hypothetical protein